MRIPEEIVEWPKGTGGSAQPQMGITDCYCTAVLGMTDSLQQDSLCKQLGHDGCIVIYSLGHVCLHAD